MHMTAKAVILKNIQRLSAVTERGTCFFLSLDLQ